MSRLWLSDCWYAIRHKRFKRQFRCMTNHGYAVALGKDRDFRNLAIPKFIWSRL